jgi:hypothetical protein
VVDTQGAVMRASGCRRGRQKLFGRGEWELIKGAEAAFERLFGIRKITEGTLGEAVVSEGSEFFAG